MFDIQVGTTEEFQGTEKDAIIVSTRVPNLAKFSLVVVSSFSGSSEKFSVVVAISVASH